ncbi:MAG TPA: replicative DNA helicase [Phycisphaerae bacterium]|nr:replicative DNA helicase [Phycisphaerae bacterium]
MTTAVAGKRSVPTSVRVLPEDRGAEAAVLGSMMIDPRCIGDVVEILDRTAFFHTENQHLWDAIVSLWSDDGETGVNGMLVRQKLERSGTLEDAGGVEYLQQVLDTLPSSAAVKYYANIVKNKAMLRELITASADILTDAYDETGEPREKVEAAERRIFGIVERGIVSDVVPAADLARTVYARIENRKAGELTGLCSGYSALDVMTTGFQPGDLVIVAARPSMGKTALAMNMVEYMSVDCRQPGAVFSLEMSRELLMERLLVSRAMVGGQRVRQGTAGADDFRKLVGSLDEICDTNNIYIDDTAALTPLLLRAKARRLKARYGIQYVVVDYLQLMTMGSGWRDGRQAEVSAISRQVKAMARELGVPVIALSQLNRGPEDREDKRPRLSDLRESGAIEQDADTVLFLHREDYYHRNDPHWNKDHTGELIVAKQRNGPTGMVKLTWLEDAVRFANQATVASAP